MNILRLYKEQPRINRELIERYKHIPTPALTDCLERCCATEDIKVIGQSLSSLNGKSMAGTAFTVRTRPGDNLVVHKALDMAKPGDVLVIDARGHMTNAILGELMTTYAAYRGLAGIVVNGIIRDSHEISQGQIPVFAKGFGCMGPYKSGPGEIHGSVQIGGAVVHDGDLIVGDWDAVVAVSAKRAREVIDAAEKIVASEIQTRKLILQGKWDRSWIDSALQIVEVEEDV